jgi:hypothetical protein
MGLRQRPLRRSSTNCAPSKAVESCVIADRIRIIAPEAAQDKGWGLRLFQCGLSKGSISQFFARLPGTKGL